MCTLGWSLSMMRMSYYHCVKLEASGEQCSSTVPLMYLNLKSAVYGLVAASGGSPFMVPYYYKALIHAANKKSLQDAFDLCWCSNAYASQPHPLDGTGNVAHHTTT